MKSSNLNLYQGVGVRSDQSAFSVEKEQLVSSGGRSRDAVVVQFDLDNINSLRKKKEHHSRGVAFPNTFYGLFPRWTYEMNPMD